ncbi:IgGFc-binding protein, partial [Leptosomus discolor]
FNFQGTCAYTLTKTCDSEPTLPVFSVRVKNEHRGSLKASYLDSVTVQVYDVTVTAVRAENGIVRFPFPARVDHQRSPLPATLARGRVRLRQKGRAVLIETNFRLQILYNWDDRVVVKLPGALAGKVCGMCGN